MLALCYPKSYYTEFFKLSDSKIQRSQEDIKIRDNFFHDIVCLLIIIFIINSLLIIFIINSLLIIIFKVTCFSYVHW